MFRANWAAIAAIVVIVGLMVPAAAGCATATAPAAPAGTPSAAGTSAPAPVKAVEPAKPSVSAGTGNSGAAAGSAGAGTGAGNAGVSTGAGNAGGSSTGASAGGISPGASAEAPKPAAKATAAPAQPEKAKLKVGIPQPNVGSQAPFWVAKDKGFYKEEGFAEVEVVTAERTLEGVVDGSLDFGVAAPAEAVKAILQGAPIRIVSGYRNREPYIVVVQNKIESVLDLDNQYLDLGGGPEDMPYEALAEMLREADWDLDMVEAKLVTVPGDADARLNVFNQGLLAATYILPRQRVTAESAGGKIIVDQLAEWPSDVIVANKSLVDSQPNTATGFLRATLRAMETWLNPRNRDYVLGMMQKNGFKVSETQRQTYAYDLDLYDGDLAIVPEGLSKLLKRSGLETVPSLDAVADLRHLLAAQKALGVPKRP